MATVTIPKILANFETSLSSKITAAASTLTLDRSTDADGTTLSGTYSLTLDEGTSSEEHMVVTLAGSAGTITRRGLSRADGWTEVSLSKLEHDRGASAKVTNVSQLNLQRLLNGDDAFNSVAWTGVASVAGLTTPTAGETTKAANVAYVNAVSIAGASDANITTKGIVELATSAENIAGTATGGTGASLFATPDLNAQAVQNGSWAYAADAGASDAYAITLSPAITAYAAGQSFVFKANTANTGAATLNVNALGAKDIRKYANGALSDLETNDIIASMPVSVTYDGTRFIMHSTPATSMTSAAAYESQQFFDTTAQTGAQATTLVAGATSDASALHKHLKKIGVSTFTPTSAADTKVITHSLGSVPNVIRIKYANSGASASTDDTSFGFGVFDGTNYATIYYSKTGNPGSDWATSSTKIIFVDSQTSGTLGWDATITTLTTTQFTIDVSNYATSEDIVFTWEVE